jgi:multidrug efflux system membrane fusion protein
MKAFLAARQSYLIALAILVALTAWFLSGDPTPSATDTAGAAEKPRDLVPSVRVRTIDARRITRSVVISGRTEPARAVTLRAEVEGRVIAIEAERGSAVKAGEVIVRLDPRDRPARLAEAKAIVERRRMEFDSAKALQRRNFQTEVDLAEAQANLATADAQAERIAVEVANTTVRAPFDGVLDRRPVEIGTYVTDGDEVGRILDTDPMLVTGAVTQQDRKRLVLGDHGIARLVTGQVVEGRVRYVASESASATRAFRVEMEVPNPDGALVSGVTAELSIPVQVVSAHHLSSALLSLSSSDEIGVKVVDDQDRVEFRPVKIVRASAEGMWVSGLPPQARVITVGHGFVRAGDRVRAVPEEQVSGGAAQSPPQ